MRTTINHLFRRCAFRWGTAVAISLLLVLAGVNRGIFAQGDKPADATKTGETQQMTLKRLSDVQSQEYPWGWIRWTMNAEIDPRATMTFGVVYIKAQQTNALHLHPNCDEILHVVEGSCEHRMGDKWVKMGVGDTIRIPRGAVHNARTLDEACRVVVVYDTGTRQMVPVDEKR